MNFTLLPDEMKPTSNDLDNVSIILPTFNEREGIENIIEKLIYLESKYNLEILVVDDESPDGTEGIVRNMAKSSTIIRLIPRVGRFGLASAIKEGLLSAKGDIAVVMDSDGQHDPNSIENAINCLKNSKSDLIIGSRFHIDAKIDGLSKRRQTASQLANISARKTLHSSYSHLTDYMSGFFAIRLESTLPVIRSIDVNGFKFIYELLAISKGRFRTDEIPLKFLSRDYGDSKLDAAILWDFLVSLLHSLTFRIFPRRAISFGLVGISGIFVQLIINWLLMLIAGFGFEKALPIAVITAASSNYLINNALTFRQQRLKGKLLIRGLLKFLIVASLPVIANVGLASAYYNLVDKNTLLAQLSGIVVVYIWNYAASSRFVWNTP